MSALFLLVRSGPSAGACLALVAPHARIGRDSTCEVRLRDDLVSRYHAEVLRQPGADEVLVRDLGSRNGLRVEGQRVLEHRLRLDGEIRIGRSVLVLSRVAPQTALEGASASVRALAELARLAAESDAVDSLEALAVCLRRAVPADGAGVSVYEEGMTKPLVEAIAIDGEPDAPGLETRKATKPLFTAATERIEAGKKDALAPCRAVVNEAGTRKAPVLVEDARARPDFARDAAVAGGRLRMILAIPLMVGGSFFGVSWVYRARPGLDPTERAAAETASGLIALALERSVGR